MQSNVKQYNAKGERNPLDRPTSWIICLGSGEIRRFRYWKGNFSFRKYERISRNQRVDSWRVKFKVMTGRGQLYGWTYSRQVRFHKSFGYVAKSCRCSCSCIITELNLMNKRIGLGMKRQDQSAGNKRSSSSIRTRSTTVHDCTRLEIHQFLLINSTLKFLLHQKCGLCTKPRTALITTTRGIWEILVIAFVGILCIFSGILYIGRWRFRLGYGFAAAVLIGRRWSLVAIISSARRVWKIVIAITALKSINNRSIRWEVHQSKCLQQCLTS